MTSKEKKVKNPKTPTGLIKISIRGKEYPCRVTMGALMRFKHATGKDVSDMDFTDTEEVVVFLHSCVASACKADEVDFNLSVMELADLIEPEDLNRFYASMDSETKNESSDPEKKRERQAE